MTGPIGNLFSDVKKRLNSVGREEQKLDQSEERENKYLQDLKKGSRTHEVEVSEIETASSTFLEETELARDIVEDLIAAEEDEIEIGEFFKKHEGKVKSELIQSFESSETRVERFAEKFWQELQILDREGEELGSIIDAKGKESDKERFEKARKILGEAEEKAEKAKDREETMMSRRKFIEATAGAAATSTGLKAFSNIESASKEAVRLEKKRAETSASSQDRTRREASKRHTTVKTGTGKTVEEVRLGRSGVSAEIQVLRTSADSGMTIIDFVNGSDRSVKIDLSVMLKQLSVSGLINFRSKDSSAAEAVEELRPGENFAAGAVFYNKEGSLGSIGYSIQVEDESRSRLAGEEIEPDVPEGFLHDHAVTNMNEVKQLDLDYKVVQEEGQKKFKVETRNISSSALVTNITLGLPIGWSHSGGRYIQQASTGLINTEHKLGSGKSGSMEIYINRNESSASSVGTLTLTVFPIDKPAQASYYLMPVDLN